jgi:hypothetical protein
VLVYAWFGAGLILNKIAYITGTTISVKIVAKPKPAMIVIAIELKNTVLNKPNTTPIMDRGTVNQITNGFLNELNNIGIYLIKI